MTFQGKILVFLCLIVSLSEALRPNINSPQNGVVKLESFNIRKDSITLSGFSSGGTFAQQMLVSYPSLFRGIGVFSHTYYRCGPGDGVPTTFDNVCTKLGNFTNDQLWDPRRPSADIQEYFQQNLIENPRNLRNKKLYVYTGTRSTLFSTDQSLRILNVFEPLIQNPKSIMTRVQASAFTLPSKTFGVTCGEDARPTFFISNCGISGPFEALTFILGNWIEEPRRNLRLEPLRLFDQTEFFTPNVRNSMDTEGFLYVPSRCKRHLGRCYLHFYFHGCFTGREFVGENHIRNSGYLELAETNGIIAVFPQVLSSNQSRIGCYDTFGVTGPLYATQRGAQVTIVKKMISRILGE